MGLKHPHTRVHVRLLGPCFKTGEWRAFTPAISIHVVANHSPRTSTPNPGQWLCHLPKPSTCLQKLGRSLGVFTRALTPRSALPVNKMAVLLSHSPVTSSAPDGTGLSRLPWHTTALTGSKPMLVDIFDTRVKSWVRLRFPTTGPRPLFTGHSPTACYTPGLVCPAPHTSTSTTTR